MSAFLRDWGMFLCLSFVEYIMGLYLFESLLRRRYGKAFTYAVFYAAFVVLGLISSFFAAAKVWILTVGVMIVVLVLYHTTLRDAVFFSTLYLSLLWTDAVVITMIPPNLVYHHGHINLFTALVYLATKIMAFVFVILLVRLIEPVWKKGLYDNRIWSRVLLLPIAQVVAVSWINNDFLNDKYIPAEGALYFVIFILEVIVFKTMQEVLLEKDNLREASLREQKLINEIEATKDMDQVLTMQRKRLHDYKNQIGTIGNLIRRGDVKAASELAQELSEGLAAAASLVSTQNVTFDAILNQKYAVAKSKGIGMALMVGDMSGVGLTSAEIVCVLGNLLDNAINECEKILEEGKNASIRVNISNEEDLLITVKNPVAFKVPIDNHKVLLEPKSGHGVGLCNVEEIADKYDGSLAISCDERIFTATVIIPENMMRGGTP